MAAVHVLQLDSVRLGLGRLLVPLALAVGAGLSHAQARLEHSAPFLGRPLELRVVGAPPQQRVEFLYSPGAASIPTPAGTLELDRMTTVRIAVVASDATGHATFSIPIPLDASIAEIPAHFQALVSVPSGKVLTNAAHLRLLGSRVYAHGHSRFPDPIEGGLEIIDAVHGVVSARVEFGPLVDVDLTNEEGKPVFAANFAVGAVMASSTRLVFFDPFFGATRAEVAVAAASRVLWTDAARERVYVLEKGTTTLLPARVRVFDFETAMQTEELSLPEAASGSWCTSDDHGTAFVASFGTRNGATILRRVALSSMTLEDSVAVGTPLSRGFDHLRFAAGQVFVTTHEPSSLSFASSLTRVQSGPGGMSTIVQSGSNAVFPRFEAVPAADLLLVSSKFPLVPSSSLFEQQLSVSGPSTIVPLPWVYLSCDDMVAEDGSVWVMDANDNEPPGGTEPGRLYRIDLATHQWTQYPHSWPFVGPRDLEIVRDALVDEIHLACRSVAPPIGIAPVIFVIDRRNQVERTIATARSPESLLSVPLP